MPEAKTKPVPLIEAKPNQCRYPYDGREPMCCGKPGFPWCDEHRPRVFSQAPKRKDLAA